MATEATTMAYEGVAKSLRKKFMIPFDPVARGARSTRHVTDP